MSEPRKEAALEQLRKALRKVLAYEPPPKTSQVSEQKAKYRRSSKKRVSNVPTRFIVLIMADTMCPH